MTYPRIVAVTLTAVLTLAGCATSGSAGFGTETITLRVVNESGTRIAVSVIWAGGQPVYVGEVPNRRQESFSVDHSRAARMQARVEFADGGEAFSDRLTPRPRETIELRVGVDRVPELVPVEEEEVGS